jgi:hypothetical protein
VVRARGWTATGHPVRAGRGGCARRALRGGRREAADAGAAPSELRKQWAPCSVTALAPMAGLVTALVPLAEHRMVAAQRPRAARAGALRPWARSDGMAASRFVAADHGGLQEMGWLAI